MIDGIFFGACTFGLARTSQIAGGAPKFLILSEETSILVGTGLGQCSRVVSGSEVGGGKRSSMSIFKEKMLAHMINDGSTTQHIIACAC